MRRSYILLAVGLFSASAVQAQGRVGADSATRLTRFGRDLVYGAVEGLAFAGVDQVRNDPVSWGKGWRGYGKRAASNVGEFVMQESVTEGLAAVMNRRLDYARCRCRGTSDRAWHALEGAVTDELPNGSHVLAVPRIVGAYAGSFAQASWRPESGGLTRVGLVNGTTSLALGALINLFYEFR